MFGTKEYWDDVYIGRGDFPADTYSWYTNWNEIQSHVKPYIIRRVPSLSSSLSRTSSSTSTSSKIITTSSSSQPRILIPGIGNDELLIDMIRGGYHQYCTIVVQDYSHYAIERQIDLLQSIDCTNYIYHNNNKNVEDDSRYNNNDDDPSFGTTTTSSGSVLTTTTNTIELYCCDITKKLPMTWDQSFDVIIEKGVLDAVYLSDDTNNNVQNAIYNMYKVLRNDSGMLLSISSVIPKETRQLLFPTTTTTLDSSLPQQRPFVSTTTTPNTIIGVHANNCAPTDIISTTTTPPTYSRRITQQQQSWGWIRDGSMDQNKAGCFLFRKKVNNT